MSLSKSKNAEEAFVRFVKCSFPSIIEHIHYELFQEIAGLLYCSHFLDQRTVLEDFLMLQKYLTNLNCDSYHSMFAIQLWLTCSYRKLNQFKDMLYDQGFFMPRQMSRKLEYLHSSFSSDYENRKYLSCLKVNSGRISYDLIELLTFYKELLFSGATSHKQIISRYSLQIKEIKAFIFSKCMSRVNETLSLFYVERGQYFKNCSKNKLPLTGSGAFSECISCKIRLYSKNTMLMSAFDDNSSNDSRLTVCKNPFGVKCDKCLKMDFETVGRSIFLRFNENKKIESKILLSPFEMQAISNEDSTSSITSKALLCNSTCAPLSDFSHSFYEESVTAETSGSSEETANSNGGDFKMHDLSFDMSDSFDGSGIDFEIESIQNIASTSILSHSAPSQTRTFLSTTLTSTSSSDNSISEFNEHTDDEIAFTGGSEFDSETIELDSEYTNEVLDSYHDERVIFDTIALHSKYANDDVSITNITENIYFETMELDSRCADDEMSYNDHDSASETFDTDPGTLSSRTLNCHSQALNKQDFTLKWLDTFHTSKEALDKASSDEYFKDIDFESDDSNSDVESSLFDTTVNFHDMSVRSQQQTKYWNIDKTFSPLCKSDEFKESEGVHDVADKPKRACKVTFVPDESLVTVRVFEREPEELLPDPYELDRIRFQMRIHSFNLLINSYLTTDHQAKILQRNHLYEKELKCFTV